MSATRSKRPQLTLQNEGVRVIVGLVALMWVVQVINSLDSYKLDPDGGIYARNFGRIWAIFTAPFLHASWPHLIDNTIPFVFMGLIVALRGAARIAIVTAIVIVVGGLGTWLTSPSLGYTVGASGVVFGYASYLLCRGFFNHSLVELAVGAIVAVVWGAALLSSLVPHYGVSWQGHASGAVGGFVAAWALGRPKPGAAVARTGALPSR